MRCRKVRSLLSAYSNEELIGQQQVAVREHLSTCAACRKEAAVYASIRQASGELPGIALSDDFNTGLLNRIAQERFSETRTKAYFPRRAPLVSWRLMAPVLVSAALVVFVVISMLGPAQTERGVTLTDASAQLDDLYLTVQPMNNPNMADNLQKNWSLGRQLAKAERLIRISGSLTDRGGFGDLRLASGTGQAPYGVDYFRAQPVFRVYEASGSTSAGEGNAAY